MIFRHINARPFIRSNIPLRTSLVFFLLALSAPATTSETAILAIQSDAIDLDTGTISQSSPGDPSATSGVDVQIAYNADRTPHAVVTPVRGDVELAFVAGAGFDGVSSADIPSLTFSSEAPDLPFSANDCVVVRTDQGAYFKLGNATETGLSITFNYEAL